MIDAQSIVVASTATRWYGHEGGSEICVLSQPGTRVAGWYFGVAPGVRLGVDGSALNWGLRIADCGLRIGTSIPAKSAIRNPQSQILPSTLFFDHSYSKPRS